MNFNQLLRAILIACAAAPSIYAMQKPAPIVSDHPTNTDEALVTTIKKMLQNPMVAAAINDKNEENGLTALHYMAHEDNAAAIDELLRAKADPNIQDVYGDTPLAHAVMQRRTAVVAKLLPITNLKLRNIKNAGPLDLAVLVNSPELVQQIASHADDYTLKHALAYALIATDPEKLVSHGLNLTNEQIQKRNQFIIGLLFSAATAKQEINKPNKQPALPPKPQKAESKRTLAQPRPQTPPPPTHHTAPQRTAPAQPRHYTPGKHTLMKLSNRPKKKKKPKPVLPEETYARAQSVFAMHRATLGRKNS